MRCLRTLVPLVALALLLGAASAQAQDTAAGDVSAEIQNQAIDLLQEQPLSFGVILPFGRSGSVTITPSGSTDSSNVHQSSPGAPAIWQVTGVPNAPFEVTLPSSNSVTIANGSGDSMSVTNFTRTGGSTQLFLDASGAETVNVGARLEVGANQPAGLYSGTYNITVAYN